MLWVLFDILPSLNTSSYKAWSRFMRKSGDKLHHTNVLSHCKKNNFWHWSPAQQGKTLTSAPTEHLTVGMNLVWVQAFGTKSLTVVNFLLKRFWLGVWFVLKTLPCAIHFHRHWGVLWKTSRCINFFWELKLTNLQPEHHLTGTFQNTLGLSDRPTELLKQVKESCYLCWDK